MYYIFFFVNFMLFNFIVNIVNCAPYSPHQRSGRFYGGGLDSASEYSSSVQKTYQQDINVKKPALNSWGLGYLGSNNNIFPQQTTVISSVPIAVQPRRIPIVERPLVGVTLQSGGFGQGEGLPAEEESLHIYKEESQNLSKTPLIGHQGIGQGVGIMQSDNSEKIFRKSHVSKPVITGGII